MRLFSLVVIVVLLLSAMGAFLFLILPPLVVTADEVPKATARLKLQNDVRTTGIQLLGGAILAFGALFTARTIQVSRETQVTERFTRAIDQLGSTTLAVRLGGIYALERVARNSRADHPAVFEVLTAFIREEVPMPSGTPRAKPSPANERDSPASPTRNDMNEPQRRARAGIQAAMTVIGRRRVSYDRGELNLQNSDLSGVNLYRADLSDGHYFDSRFDRCVLSEASFVGAGMYNVTFSGALLIGTRFRGALLQGADLSGGRELFLARLSRAHADSLTRWPNGFDPKAAGVKGLE